jgi:MFS family permease
MTAVIDDGSNADDTARTRYAWRVLTVSAVGAILCGVNTSTMDVALPVVSRHFNASATQASWILLSFMLANTALILIFGRVADLVGRRMLYLMGLSTLTIASLLCGLAPNANWLIAFRVLQAVGAAALLCNITALITDAFPRRLLSTALGINVSIAAAAQVLGPVLGGALVAGFGWRSVFWFNVPIGAAGLLWARYSLRREASRQRRERFDLLGGAPSAMALGGLVLALSEGGALGWSSPPVLIGIVLLVVGAPLFIRVQRRRSFAMLDLALFAERARSLPTCHCS